MSALRVAGAVAAGVLLLSGCTSDVRGELRDAVADVTAEANDRDADGVRRAVDVLLGRVSQARADGAISADEAGNIERIALAVQQNADLVDRELIEEQRRIAEEQQRLESERQAAEQAAREAELERQRLEAERRKAQEEEEQKRLEEEQKRVEEQEKKQEEQEEQLEEQQEDLQQQLETPAPAADGRTSPTPSPTPGA